MPFDEKEERRKGRAQAHVVLRMPPEDIRVAMWLGCSRYFFPDEYALAAKKDEWYALKAFTKTYGRRKLDSITALECQAWALDHSYNQVRWLSSAFNRAVLMRLIPVNPWSFAKKMTPRKKPPVRPPTSEELARIIATCEGFATEARVVPLPARGFFRTALERERAVNKAERAHRQWLEVRDIIEVAAFSGARMAGLLGLKALAVDWDEHRMTLTEKGAKTRTVFLPGRAFAALERQRERRAFALRFERNARLFDFNMNWLQVRWQKARGDFPYGFHALRHFCATWMEEEGVNPLDIAVQLGHFDEAGRPYVRMVRRVYSHPDHSRALGRIEAIVGGEDV